VTAERLQKLIAAAGITSRRKAEKLIAAGRVTVNGEVVTEIGSSADPRSDRIAVDGRELPRPKDRYLALHKPPGVTSSLRDPHAHRIVTDLLGPEIEERVYPAGRLDRDSEGLMILLNDGELMHAMTRPTSGVDKVYEVTVRGAPDPHAIEWLEEGAEIRGRKLLPCTIEPLGGAGPGRVFRVTLHEGKKNQIRRMFARIGHPVVRLIRRRIGPVELGDLRPGEYRDLTASELAALRRAAGMEEPGP
jgi:pseudouridine synthase